MRDAYGVIVHQAAHSSRWRTENVDNIFVLFSQKNIFSRLIGHLGKIQIRKSKLVSLISSYHQKIERAKMQLYKFYGLIVASQLNRIKNKEDAPCHATLWLLHPFIYKLWTNI